MSPSPSMSTKSNLPEISLKPNELAAGTAKTGMLAGPIFLKNTVLPASLPIKASKSPSLSISVKVGLAPLNPNGLLIAAVKAGLVAVPRFLKKSVFALLLPNHGRYPCQQR